MRDAQSSGRLFLGTGGGGDAPGVTGGTGGGCRDGAVSTTHAHFHPAGSLPARAAPAGMLSERGRSTSASPHPPSGPQPGHGATSALQQAGGIVITVIIVQKY